MTPEGFHLYVGHVIETVRYLSLLATYSGIVTVMIAEKSEDFTEPMNQDPARKKVFRYSASSRSKRSSRRSRR